MAKRRNPRKTVRRRSRPPKFEVNWQALLVPPVVLAALIAFFVSGKMIFDRPVSQLIIEGPFQRVTAIQVEAALAPELGPGFLSIDLDRLGQRAESLGWIESVKIRRVWPDKLVINLTEHRAAARWGDHGLLNVRGELFTPNARHALPELPRLAGPPGSESEVAEFYLAVRGRMAEASLTLGALHMDARGAWSMALAGGQKVRLGRHDIQRRLDTFFDVVAPVLATRFHEVDYVDLRYANGFAVGWLKAKPATGLSNTLEGYGNG